MTPQKQPSTDTVFADTVRQATLDPNWFCDTILRCPNDPWQAEMMDAIADLDRIRLGIEPIYNPDALNRFTIAAFHGPGKTHIIAKLMHWWNFTRKGRIAVTAPKEKQLTTRVWPEFRKILGKAIDEYRALIKVDKTSITWCGDVDWTALAESAASPENLAGLHDEWLLYLVEEASGVAEEMFPAIEGALASEGAVLVMIGNPTRTSGEFHASHCKRGTMELYYRKKIQHHEAPRIPQKWIDDMIAKYGKDSPVVQVRVFGNFVDTEENQLLALEWLQRAIDREFIEDGSIPTFRVSVDVADGGLDSSVVVVSFNYESFRYFRKQSIFNYPSSVAPIRTAESAALIYDALQEEFPDLEGDLVVDSIGVGAGTAGWLIEKGYPVISYKGGASSDDSEQWRNRRTQSHLCYRNDLRDDRIIIADDYCDPDDWDDFLAQCVSIKTKPGDERVEDLETKEHMKARGVKSPDMPEAKIMAYATDTPTVKGDLGLMTTFDTARPASDW